MGGEGATKDRAGADMIRRIVTIWTTGRIRHRRRGIVHPRAGLRRLGGDRGHRKEQCGEGEKEFHRL